MVQEVLSPHVETDRSCQRRNRRPRRRRRASLDGRRRLSGALLDAPSRFRQGQGSRLGGRGSRRRGPERPRQPRQGSPRLRRRVRGHQLLGALRRRSRARPQPRRRRRRLRRRALRLQHSAVDEEDQRRQARSAAFRHQGRSAGLRRREGAAGDLPPHDVLLRELHRLFRAQEERRRLLRLRLPARRYASRRRRRRRRRRHCRRDPR